MSSTSFRNVYRLARLNRGSIHFRGEFFRFDGGGDVYVGTTGELVIGRQGRYGSDQPGWHVGGLVGGGSSSSVDFRRYVLDGSRECRAVPLP